MQAINKAINLVVFEKWNDLNFLKKIVERVEFNGNEVSNGRGEGGRGLREFCCVH